MGINLKPKIISELRAIGEKYAISKIVLFGSRARGDNKAKSDIDIAIYPIKGFENKGHLISDIDDLETFLKIDVKFINQYTDEKLLDNIQRDGVIIYERLHI